MQYSPKLKTAMEEIKSILNKHDIAGFFVIHTPGFSEYLNHVSPSYSCAKMEGGEFRVKLKTAEVGREKAKKIAEGTLNMVTHFAEQVGKHAMFYIDAEEMLKKYWTSDETRGGETSHEQQNN